MKKKCRRIILAHGGWPLWEQVQVAWLSGFTCAAWLPNRVADMVTRPSDLAQRKRSLMEAYTVSQLVKTFAEGFLLVRSSDQRGQQCAAAIWT